MLKMRQYSLQQLPQLHEAMTSAYATDGCALKDRMHSRLSVCMLLRARATIISSRRRSRFFRVSRGTLSFATATPQQNPARMDDRLGLTKPPGGEYAQHLSPATSQFLH